MAQPSSCRTVDIVSDPQDGSRQAAEVRYGGGGDSWRLRGVRHLLGGGQHGEEAGGGGGPQPRGEERDGAVERVRGEVAGEEGGAMCRAGGSGTWTPPPGTSWRRGAASWWSWACTGAPPPSPATCRNCFLHLAALQQEGVITEAALLLAMVGLQQALVARGATLPHPRLRPGTDCDFGDTSLIEGEETQGLESFSN